MKITTTLSLVFLFFGYTHFYTQNTDTKVVHKRTYTKKEELNTGTTNQNIKPERTYATKPIKAELADKKDKDLGPKTNNEPSIIERIEKKDSPKKSESSFWSWLFGKKSSQKTSVSKNSTNKKYKNRTIYTGPNGGRYYINKNGNKTYIH
ncbi:MULTISPECIES: hypothetical protein [Amniculibacterium]|uniref:hypothetical protein n=1 Tax=Amniculibacterium TaxID=2715289 RepID=UPI000F59E147|nr:MULTISPECIES: hypothetical protein [Amniculibacterium]